MLQTPEERHQEPRQDDPEIFGVALFGLTVIIIIALLTIVFTVFVLAHVGASWHEPAR
jgi:hypothetical protein